MKLLAKKASRTRREKDKNNRIMVSTTTAAKAFFATTAFHAAQAFVVGGGGAQVPHQRLLCSSSSGKVLKKNNNDNGILVHLHSTSGSTRISTTMTSSSTRLFSSFRKRDDDDNDGGFLSKLGSVAKNAAKSILPSTWFQSEKEQKAALERKRVQNQLSRDVNEVLKNAPLPVRMLGSVVAPLLGNVMSGLAETMAEQQQTVDALLQRAQTSLENDDVVANVLGSSGSIQVGAPFSQSSSSTSINGQTQTGVELAFAVSGSRGSGVARLTAANNEIQQLILQTSDGRSISVNVSKGGGGGRRQVQGGGGKMSSSSSSNDNIIEAEIIEKDTKKR